MAIKTTDASEARKLFGQSKFPVYQPESRVAPVTAEVIPQEVSPVVMRFTLPVPPSVNSLYLMVDGIRVKSAGGKAYSKTVAGIVSQANFHPFQSNVGVRLRVFRKQHSGDLDNYAKALFDSLKGICWIDDRQIIYIESHRFDDKENPRVEVEIWEVKP